MLFNDDFRDWGRRMLGLAVKHRLRHRLGPNVAARFDDILFKRGNSL